MLVADTSAIAHLHIAGERHAAAVAAYRRDPDWLTVPLWRYEFVNVLLKHHRAGNLDGPMAHACLCEALKRMVPGEQMPGEFRPFEIARNKGVSVYDAYFAAVAEDLELQLLTEDRELLAKFPETAVSLEVFNGV
jgi:predicted nucleic acid-binding protein